MNHFHPEPKVVRSSLFINKRSGKKRRFKCEHCSKIYKRNHFLARHIANIHPKIRNGGELNQLKANQEEKFKFESGPKCFSTKTEINNVREKLLVVQCPICSKWLSRNADLKLHIENVHEKEKFNCDFCNRCYSSEQALKRHMTVAHNKITDFKCKSCNFYFGSRSTLNAHIKRVHTQTKEHVCAVCDKAFGNICHLNDHANVHLKLKEFECHLCHQKFGYKNTLSRHMINIHGK